MKILHVNSYYYGSKFYKNLYERQIESGIDVKVFVPVNYSANLSNLQLGRFAELSKNHGKFDRYVFKVKHSKILNDLFKKVNLNDYEIIHAHSLFSNGYIANQIYHRHNIPYIVAVRNTDIYTFFKYMIHLRKIGIEILKDAEKVIFLSKGYRDFLVNKYIPKEYKATLLDKSIVIPNGIESFWFKNIPNKKTIDNKKIKLIYVGKVNKNKNLITTIKAIELLIAQDIDVTYTIVGDVEDKKIFNKINNIPFVNYLGSFKKEKLLDVYRENDIFIMPSIHESFGLVYGEAMSQGLPVIYTKGQGFDGQFEEGEVGFSVDPNSPEDIAQKIKKIISDYEKISMSSTICSHKFKWEIIEKEYKDIYMKITN